MARETRRWMNYELKTFLEMRKEGKTYREIGRKLHRTKNSVVGFANRQKGYKTTRNKKTQNNDRTAWTDESLTERWADRKR